MGVGVFDYSEENFFSGGKGGGQKIFRDKNQKNAKVIKNT